jgi:hypothetical protein
MLTIMHMRRAISLPTSIFLQTQRRMKMGTVALGGEM